MNTDDGALYVPLTGDSKQFIGAIDEAERRVKGFSTATVAEGQKIDKAFRDLTQRVKESKDAIAGTEADIKKMESMLKPMAPGAAKSDMQGEVNAAKRALQEEKVVLAQLEGQLKSTAGAHLTLRTQLRQMKEELVGMEAAGKRGTAGYAALQGKFADLTNAMGDAQKQANVLANDERGMQGLIMGFSGLTGAASAAQGAIGLFSGENKNLQKVMLKVQSLMAITIGMQQVQQTLNKDSAFMLVTVAKAKNMLAAAELRFATALGISNVAAKALMATLTLGLSVAIGVAIAAITRLVNKSQEAKKATQEFNSATADAAYKSIAGFERMRQEWTLFGDDMKAKNKYIKDNADAFEELGVQVKSVSDAENILITNKDKFIESQIAKAKSVAGFELAAQKYKEALQKMQEAESMDKTKSRYLPSGIPGEAGSTIEVENKKYTRTVAEARKLEEEAKRYITGAISQANEASKKLGEIGVTTTENLEKIILLEQKISEQERLMLEAAEAGNKAEVKVIQGRIDQLKEELRLRNMLVNALYAQGRANDVISNVQSGAFQPAAPSGSLGAPSTGGKPAGARYWQTPVFDLESAKKTLSVMDAQAVIARNAEAVAKKKKKVDDEMVDIAENELDIRIQIVAAVGATISNLERAGLLSEELGSILGGYTNVFVSMLSSDPIGAITSAVGMYVKAIGEVFDANAGFEERLERMNTLLEKQARLVEQSKRKGGEKDAMEAEIALLLKQVKLYEDQAAAAEKRLQNAYKWNLTGTQREKELKEVQAAAKEAQIALEDARQAYTDFLAGGITENTLADTIMEGLQQGKISVDDFAGYMNDMLTDAVLKSFSAQILGPAITELQQMVAQALLDGVLSEEEAKAIQARASEIAKENEEKYKEATRGLRTEEADQTLQGAIKGITEETAGVLAGQVNAMRINQVEGIQIMRQQLARLSEIAFNTGYNKYLLSIDNRLAAMSADNLRSQGLNG